MFVRNHELADGRHRRLRIGNERVHRLRCPQDAASLHRRRVAEVLHHSRLAAKQPVEARSDALSIAVDRVTRNAFLELLLAARGVDVSRIRFSTAFGRGLDYYTGFVFELHNPAAPPNGPLVAGGIVNVRANYRTVYHCLVRRLEPDRALEIVVRPAFLTIVNIYEVAPTAGG